MKILSLLKKMVPKEIRDFKHLWYALYGAVKYKHPSEELLVIGVTGTSGKSTTIFLLRQLLEHAGYKVGSLSTIDFYINGKNKLNDEKMTMLGKMKTQEYLAEMVDKGCEVAIVETTSEGQLQFRDRYIAYDFMVLTNLYPEHIEAHGSFANYKQAKLDIFRRAGSRKNKILENKEIIKTAFINSDIAEAEEFLHAGNWQKKILFGTKKSNLTSDEEFVCGSVESDENGLHFTVGEYRFDPDLFGAHNAMNILITIAIARQLQINWNVIQKAVHNFKNAPGRNEFIPEAEKFGFKVIVDYAFEPKAMAGLYSVVDLLKPKRIIHVFGSTGGGRDVSRRFTVGKLVGEKADICIITNEDPYDDDPKKIMEDVASAVRKTGKRDGSNLFIIPDRREAIRRALQIADMGDLVLVTGKGCEQAMCVAGGRKIPWDDREIVREELCNP
jgi:UDP-N-acetylmuramoyl-L-alanyl-D-glutamate--2,6-diaminopimelate ligase